MKIEVGQTWQNTRNGYLVVLSDEDEESVSFEGSDVKFSKQWFLKTFHFLCGEGYTQKEQNPDDRAFNHYYINVSGYEYIDIYRVTDLYGATAAEHHAVKKILCGGKCGAKDKIKDLKEAIASIERQIEMIEEDSDA